MLKPFPAFQFLKLPQQIHSNDFSIKIVIIQSVFAYVQGVWSFKIRKPKEGDFVLFFG